MNARGANTTHPPTQAKHPAAIFEYTPRSAYFLRRQSSDGWMDGFLGAPTTALGRRRTEIQSRTIDEARLRSHIQILLSKQK